MPIAPLLPIAVLAVWVALEGRTILTSLRAAGTDGAARLNRLGLSFLSTEAWTLALLGSLHAVLPSAAHDVYAAVPWAPALFVGGWMLRDFGLWMGPRLGAGRIWRLGVASGAALQVLGVLGVLAGFALIRPALSVGAGADLMLLVAPPVLVLGLVLHRLLMGLRVRPAAPARVRSLGVDAPMLSSL